MNFKSLLDYELNLSDKIIESKKKNPVFFMFLVLWGSFIALNNMEFLLNVFG